MGIETIGKLKKKDTRRQIVNIKYECVYTDVSHRES